MELAGLNTEPLPDNWTPLDAIAVIKCLDEEGETALVLRTSDGLRVWDSVGLLTVALDTQRQTAQDMFESEDDEDQDE